jgi:NADH-quinone oxidoreductase subunit I
MWTVPAPPPLEAGAEEPKEVAAARKAVEKAEQAAQAEAAARAAEAGGTSGEGEPS